MSNTSQITLLLNADLITVEVAPGLVALDFLRNNQRLTGSKEGCKEGDCGACTVIVGTVEGDRISYQPMTSCLLPMGELHGKHLVSIEGLNRDTLSPIQSSLVECGGTQCGYCTPGFVVAMTAGLMDETLPLDKTGVSSAISGNLCRCTGYRSIKEAGLKAINVLAPAIKSKPRISALVAAKALPDYFDSALEKLKGIPPQTAYPMDNDSPFVAGGTDLYVQQGEILPERDVTLLNTKPVMPISLVNDLVTIDARMTFEAFARDPIIRDAIPKIESYNNQIASWPIRARATLGGNICNASPIADLTCLLIALNAELTIDGPNGIRTCDLRSFYLDYKKLAKEANERVTTIRFRNPSPNAKINWEKVSKRRVLDIATVNSAIQIEVSDQQITNAHLALGGVSATPLYLSATSETLKGCTLSLDTVFAAIEIAMGEFTPISDVRGSADYKRILARQLLLSHFITLFPEQIKEEELYETSR